MKYNIITSNKVKEVVKKVNELLEDGWDLHGGVVLSITEGEDVFAQALTKTEIHDAIKR